MSLDSRAKGHTERKQAIIAHPGALALAKNRGFDTGTESWGDWNMSISIEMTAQEIASLKQITKLENDAEAVTKAVREFLRLSRLRELKAVSGKVDFENNWNWNNVNGCI